MAAPTVVNHGYRIPLGDISLSESSGWRPAQAGVVRTFEIDFPMLYGRGIQRAPRVLLKEIPQGDAACKFQEDAEGKALLDDGKSTIGALLALLGKWKANELPEESCSPDLLEVLRTSTIAVQLVWYPTDDSLERQAHNALAHEDESNKYLPTTLSQKIGLVWQVKQTVQGGEWSNVQAWFETRYGQGKSTSIKRMIMGARCLTPSLLEFVAERSSRLGHAHGMLDNHFLQNDFFMGLDARKANQRLEGEEQLQAAHVMAATLDDERPVAAAYFREKVRSFFISSFLHSSILNSFFPSFHHSFSPLFLHSFIPSLPPTRAPHSRSAAPSGSSTCGAASSRRSTQTS